MNFLIDGPAWRGERTQRQTRAQVPCALHSASAEFSQAERKAIDAGDDIFAGPRVERDVTEESGGKALRRRRSLLPCAARAQTGMTLSVRVYRIEVGFRNRPLQQSELDRDVVEPAWREAAIEMPHPRNDHADDGHFDVETRLIEDEEIETGALGNVDAGHHLLAGIETAELRGEVQRSRGRTIRQQVGMIPQTKRAGLVFSGCVPGSKQSDG